MENCSDYDAGSGIDEDAIVDVDLGTVRDRGVRYEMRGKEPLRDGIDGSMDNIKITILSFKGRSDSEAYLE